MQLKKCDLVKYFKSRFPNIPIHRSGEYYIARCPHPDHRDENPSFRIHYDAATGWYSWTCFSCHCGKKGERTASGKINKGSDAVAFVMWLSDYNGSSHVLTFQEAVLVLLKFFHIPIPEEKKRPVTKQEHMNCILSNTFQEYFHDSLAEKYVLSRGLNHNILLKYHVGTDGYRLAIPLTDYHNRIQGFIYRHLNGEEPKYIHSSAKDGFIKSQYLFGLEHLDLSRKSVFITEGCLDVMMADQYGMKNVLACLGTAFTDGHAVLLKNLGITEVVLVFDSDPAGRHATSNAIQLLHNVKIQCKVISLPDEMDLCDFAKTHKEKTEEDLVWYTVPDYEYELGPLAKAYQEKKKKIQQEYLSDILKKAMVFTIQKDYDLFRQYIFSEFDIRLEQEHVRKTQTDLENPVPPQTAA